MSPAKLQTSDVVTNVKATAKAMHTSARKMGMVAALVRGRSLADAKVILEHTPRRAARLLLEVVNSAAANAENNHKQSKGNLVVSAILVSPGMIIKRYRMGSRGHYDKNTHRTCHVTVILSSDESAKPRKIAATPTANKPTAKPRSK